jgi:glycosyltransferase involved in cell wall biosynthesis
MAEPEVSLIVPVFNEEENLPVLAGEIEAAMAATPYAYEIVYVDDGSTDGSPEVLRRLADEEPRARILRLRRNSGLSAALDAGFRHARGEVLVSLDSDLQNDPADIPRLLAELAGCDVVCGVRARRRDDWLRRISSRVANAVRNWATAESIADVGCTLRAYRAEYVRRIPMFSGMHRFLPTLLRFEGARIKEVPVNHRPRLHGEPKYNVRNRIFKALADLMAVRWMRRRRIDRRLVEEIEGWSHTTYGSPSASPARPSSSPASSSSGSPPNAASAASSPEPSGS